MQIALNMRRRKEHLSEANSFRYFLSYKVCTNNLRKEKLDSLWRSTPWLYCCDCCQNIGDALDDHLFEVLLHRMFNFTHISGMYFFLTMHKFGSLDFCTYEFLRIYISARHQALSNKCQAISALRTNLRVSHSSGCSLECNEISSSIQLFFETLGDAEFE